MGPHGRLPCSSSTANLLLCLPWLRLQRAQSGPLIIQPPVDMRLGNATQVGWVVQLPCLCTLPACLVA